MKCYCVLMMAKKFLNLNTWLLKGLIGAFIIASFNLLLVAHGYTVLVADDGKFRY